MLARIHLVAALCVVAVVSSVGLAQFGETLPAGQPLVTVGDVTITTDDVEALLADAPAIPAQQRAEIVEMIVQRMIAREIVQIYVQARDLQADPAMIEERMEMIAERAREMGITTEELMEQARISHENVKTDVAMKQHIDAATTPERVEAFMAAHPSFFDGTRKSVSHILIVSSPFDATEKQQEARGRLEDIRRQIVTGEIEFAEAARKYSDCPSKQEGGSLGEPIGFDLESMAAAFVLAAFSTPEGEISPVFRTEFGWHIVKVNEVIPGDGQPVADAEARAAQGLVAQINSELISLSSGPVQVVHHAALKAATQPATQATQPTTGPATEPETQPVTQPGEEMDQFEEEATATE